MKLELNPDKIKQVSQNKEGENWSFRSFLKTCEIHDSTVDRTVKKLYQKIHSKINCCKCSNCCKESIPHIGQDEIKNIAAGLSMSAQQFKQAYLVKHEDDDDFVFNRKPCPFLDGNLCSIYAFRPQGCRDYPGIPEKGFKKRLVAIIHNCTICPIVFNLVECLKKEIWALDDMIDDFEEVAEEDFLAQVIGDPLDDIIDDLDLDSVDDW